METDAIKIRDTRKKSFFIVDNETVDIMLSKIGANAFTTYCILCRHSDKKQKSFPSQSSILKKLGLKDRKSIQKAIKTLQDNNMINVKQIKEEGTGKFMHNLYTLIDKSKWAPVGTQTVHGNHGDSDGTRFEANPVGTQTDTNNTHGFKKTNILKKFEKTETEIPTKGGLTPTQKRELKEQRKRDSGFYNQPRKSKPAYKVNRKTAVYAEDL